MEVSDLIDFNPWWSSGSVPVRLLEEDKRELYYKIEELIPTEQIVSIVGLRRTGKTTIMYQLIDALLNDDIQNERIMYFSFDKEIKSLEEIIKTYKREVLMEESISKKTYLFFDEIQKLDDWENQIKLLYDKKLPVKIILSGSSSMTIQKSGKETLAGRNYIQKLSPLNFKEYLKLKGESITTFTDIEGTYKKARLNEGSYITKFNKFVNFHGLPETIDMSEELSKRYIKSSLIDQVIYKDIPSNYSIEDPSVIEELLRIIAERPGMLLRFDSLASDLKRTRQTISKYIFYLENSFLLNLLYNYSGSFITSAKKLKKVYFSHPCIVNSLRSSIENMGRLVENHLINELGIKFFHRKNQKEVDGIIRDSDSIIPVEIKYRGDIKEKDQKNIVDFIEKEDCGVGLMVTKDTFDIEGNIPKIPAYFLLMYKGEIMEYVKKD